MLQSPSWPRRRSSDGREGGSGKEGVGESEKGKEVACGRGALFAR